MFNVYKMNKQEELAKSIIDKCKELGCETDESTVELIGGATLLVLGSMGEYVGASFDDMRKAYIEALSTAKVNV